MTRIALAKNSQVTPIVWQSGSGGSRKRPLLQTRGADLPLPQMPKKDTPYKLLVNLLPFVQMPNGRPAQIYQQFVWGAAGRS